MSQEDLSFENFVDILFSAEREEDRMYGPIDEAPDELVVSHMQRFLTDPRIVLGSYTEDEIADGVDEFCSVASTDLGERLLDADISLYAKRRTIYLMRHLFTKLFADLVAATPERADIDERKIELVCHMFWDCFISHYKPEHANLLGSIFSTLDAIAMIPNYSCQFSALHGIGHFAEHDPAAARLCAKRYLKNSSSIAALHDYARDAAKGRVL